MHALLHTHLTPRGHAGCVDGVLFACSDALQAHGLSQAALISECARRGGAVQFMARACDRHWRTLVF